MDDHQFYLLGSRRQKSTENLTQLQTVVSVDDEGKIEDNELETRARALQPLHIRIHHLVSHFGLFLCCRNLSIGQTV